MLPDKENPAGKDGAKNHRTQNRSTACPTLQGGAEA